MDKSYKCDVCGGWMDYTGKIEHGYKIVKHRSARKETRCGKIWANNYKVDCFDNRHK